MNLKNQWLPVAWVNEIKTRPKRFLLCNMPLVLFKLKEEVIVLQDRCPHRGVPLSEGTVTKNSIQCCYHGWRFNAQGLCVAIPGLNKPIDTQHYCVPAYAAQVHLGMIFVCLEPDEHTLPLYSVPALQGQDYLSHCIQFPLKGDLLNVLENVLDATHTHFVHAGLLRHHEKRQLVTATLTVEKFHAEIRYDNEDKQSGWVSSFFEQDRQFSIGRFHSPLIAELEYHGSQHLTAGFAFFLSPVNDGNEYRVFLLIIYRNHWFNRWVKKFLLLPFIHLAFKQDKTILNKQRMNGVYFPKSHFKSTELDILRPHIERILSGKSIPTQKVLKLLL
ncbi:Rieske 2Fe-2S domain-containing protein [Legionella cincinnatiensis]|uniref:Rieske 2Fe-2S domain protein n=1 Tax=Legionella cincinnatiensis TaxID=28085 RepID=A0A378IME0_9GAMM|nr:Rieske 2Fe-2S domain-containing protein [Legionella cincinnatiensis]KTC88559.1 Rieske 2Fe-2S domain protein [Legionella cincinnatiensis]STX35952.1 Rieske 2Fe-2S domain protein [Legionella cincinnatiensis]